MVRRRGKPLVCKPYVEERCACAQEGSPKSGVDESLHRRVGGTTCRCPQEPIPGRLTADKHLRCLVLGESDFACGCVRLNFLQQNHTNEMRCHHELVSLTFLFSTKVKVPAAASQSSSASSVKKRAADRTNKIT